MRIEPIARPGPDGYSVGRPVVLADDLYTPHRNFVFCHELAHILLGHTVKTTKRLQNEFDADHLAADLMLPPEEFKQMMAESDFLGVRLQCPHASWEVVARRWGQLRPAAVTIFDNRKVTTRIAPKGMVCPPRPTEIELELVRQTIEARDHLQASDPPLKLASYFIDEGRGVERVILLTEVEEIFD